MGNQTGGAVEQVGGRSGLLHFSQKLMPYVVIISQFFVTLPTDYEEVQVIQAKLFVGLSRRDGLAGVGQNRLPERGGDALFRPDKPFCRGGRRQSESSVGT